MGGGMTGRTVDYFGVLVAMGVFALISAVVTALCITYEERFLAYFWTAAFFGFALAAAYSLWRLL
jgi:hypothetical protein